MFLSYHADDYRAHTSCITESERYEKKTAKTSKRNPQQEWMDVVRSCVSSSPPHLRNYMQTMAGLDNIPRKEKQFRNLASNSLGLRGSNGKIVDEIWNCLQNEREKRMAVKGQQQQQEDQKQKKQVQQELQEDTTEMSHNGDESSLNPKVDTLVSEMGNAKSIGKTDAKKVKSAAKKVLKKAPNRSMKTKELRKLLGKELPSLAKDRLKELLADATKSTKSKLKVDGKMISLN